ncbi:MAG: hypothetical protein ABSG13_20830 [Bryobacteraceae bacterium]|jgi:hypothetical protein
MLIAHALDAMQTDTRGQLVQLSIFVVDEPCRSVDGLIGTERIGLLRKWDGPHAAIIARTKFDLDNEHGFV